MSYHFLVACEHTTLQKSLSPADSHIIHVYVGLELSILRRLNVDAAEKIGDGLCVTVRTYGDPGEAA
ncbi:hypothetical protein R3O65_08535 [Corynebacterium pseudodiphtheriticum]|uniref:hypothetical protein n=1 Tax=Corynebacterium pseudodiphtheriticum TaxID=37637 RepID=UPI002542A5F8|nr:hypothetical protein [Corynebacterium pseudodiphtheriticum]MDK4242335.1 hypothetical protein [Corynebacterium pseudodiphtheriticum]